ncbi:MAG: helix-turn-helix transcriptional regulator [Oscillospiraceae bacterium]|nr:helix-turn-helix transcriptional regulator [Oscillospiraceae bacterium]
MNTSIGKNIKTMRLKCSFTQDELAERLSVTPQAVSKWENGNGMPDITQLVPLAQIFGITTDSLLGVVSATYGKAHTEAACGHVKLLMSTSQPNAEKHLAAYTYLRAESEKEPSNYVLMRKCINHAAEISRYTDFNGFMSDYPEIRDEIFEDCERKNSCIARYCEDKENIEKSDFAMAWIYMHTKQFDKAKKLIDRLPSLASNNMKESIMAQYIQFQFGFEREKSYIYDNIYKLLKVTSKEFLYSLEDFSCFAEGAESINFGHKVLAVLESYKAFNNLEINCLIHENTIRRFMPRCYAKAGDFESAGKELITIAENYIKIFLSGIKYKDTDEAKSDAYAHINAAVGLVDKNLQDKIKISTHYGKAISIIDTIK